MIENVPTANDLTSLEARNFKEEVERLSGQRLVECYQCFKCTAGCPLASEMDLDPGRVMRLVQLGQKERALRCDALWLCASCETCATRCPQEVDLAKVMDALRTLAVRDGYAEGNKGTALLNRLFLANVEANGRVHEMGLVARYNLASGQPLKDAEKGPRMFLKGKLHPLPHKSKNASAVRRVFARAKEAEAHTP